MAASTGVPRQAKVDRVAARTVWPEALPEVFLGSELVARGVLTRRQLRDQRLRRHMTDVYSPRWVPHDHVLDCRGAWLVAPSTARLTGASLATVLGVRMRDAGDDVEFVLPQADRKQPRGGIRLRGAARGPLGTALWRDIPITTPERMAFDIAARRPVEDGVADLDAALSARLFDRDRFCSWLTDRHEDDVVAVREMAALSDRRAGSRPESRLRVRLVRAQLGVVFEPQHVVLDQGRFVARVDLAVVGLRIAVEYEGAWHGLIADQLAKDRHRLDRLREAGWIVVHVTADMMREPGMAVDAVRRAIAQRTS